MRAYLLDTCILLWWLGDSPQLPQEAREILTQNNSVFVSAATIWEIAIKKALNKLQIPDNLMEEIENNNFNHLPITAAHALIAASLPRHHDDPFDRMLIAQAQKEGLILITTDTHIKRYNIGYC